MALEIVLVVCIKIMITRKLLSLLPQHTSSVVRQSVEVYLYKQSCKTTLTCRPKQLALHYPCSGHVRIGWAWMSTFFVRKQFCSKWNRYVDGFMQQVVFLCRFCAKKMLMKKCWWWRSNCSCCCVCFRERLFCEVKFERKKEKKKTIITFTFEGKISKPCL